MRLIGQAGLDAVTVRDVAEAAGCSTAIVSHYFHNKKDLLLQTYRATIDHVTDRAEVAVAANDGDVKAYLAQIMPLDEERLTEWKIWMAFWAKAASDEEFATIQRDCVVTSRQRILDLLRDLEARGDLVAGADLAHVARRMLATIMGLAVQVMFDPQDWPNERQHGLIDRDLCVIYRPARLPRSIAQAAAARPLKARSSSVLAGE